MRDETVVGHLPFSALQQAPVAFTNGASLTWSEVLGLARASV